MTLVRPKPGNHPARRPSRCRAAAGLTARAILPAAILGLALAPGCGRGADSADSGAPKPFDVVAAWGEVGLNPGQFTYPRALDTDGTNLWAIDKSARVQRLDPKTG